MKILTLDIETSPNLADVWSLWNQNVSLNQLRETSKVICFAAKWKDKSGVLFHSDHHDGHSTMVASAHALIDEADVVVHYNGTSFDMPHLHREFLLGGLTPPSPVQEIDLYRVVKKRFRFASNKLDHVSHELGLGGKVSHSGHTLWVKCMAGDAKAWADMKRYNVGDVRLTERVYDYLLPWIHNHPQVGLYTGEDYRCRCGAGRDQLQRRGVKAVGVSVYPQFRCNVCGSWFRGKTAINRVDERGVA